MFIYGRRYRASFLLMFHLSCFLSWWRTKSCLKKCCEQKALCCKTIYLWAWTAYENLVLRRKTWAPGLQQVMTESLQEENNIRGVHGRCEKSMNILINGWSIACWCYLESAKVPNRHQKHEEACSRNKTRACMPGRRSHARAPTKF